MRTRGSLLAVLVCFPLSLPGDIDTNQKDIQSVELSYEGKLVRLNYAPQVGRFTFELPKSERRSLDPNDRAYLRISRVERKKSELQFWARRVVFYRDARGADSVASGKEEKYKLRWKGVTPDAQGLREAQATLLTPIDSIESDWPDYWPIAPAPPFLPSGAEGRDLNLEPRGGVYRIGGKISAPVCVVCPEPDYPEDLRKARVEGVVVLWVVIDEAGQAKGLRITRSLHAGLDKSAALAVGRWRFRPAQRDGKPVPVYMTVEVDFHLY